MWGVQTVRDWWMIRSLPDVKKESSKGWNYVKKVPYTGWFPLGSQVERSSVWGVQTVRDWWKRRAATKARQKREAEVNPSILA